MPASFKKKEESFFQKPGVYRIPCECGLVYIGETGRNLSLRLKEHKTNCEKAELKNQQWLNTLGLMTIG